MKIQGNTVLITGGATGIGFALAESFIHAGNTVIICGRREDKLKEAKKKLPQIYPRACDLTKEKERESLFNWAKENFKDINILINNAGIQTMIDLKKGAQEPVNGKNEIETNMPVYCATKAAIHSFTVSLRYQLRDTPIKVFELVPPAVDTELGRGTAEEGETEYRGIPPGKVAQAALSAMADNEYEIFVGEAKDLAMRARTNPQQAFKNINQW